jgi:hypothetical protein
MLLCRSSIRERRSKQAAGASSVDDPFSDLPIFIHELGRMSSSSIGEQDEFPSAAASRPHTLHRVALLWSNRNEGWGIDLA